MVPPYLAELKARVPPPPLRCLLSAACLAWLTGLLALATGLAAQKPDEDPGEAELIKSVLEGRIRHSASLD